MNNSKELAFEMSSTYSLVWLVSLTGIAAVAPLFHQQAITGPVVNATLFLAIAILGFKKGIFIGLIPSVIALSVGTLPAALSPVVPYIMISNVILMFIFSFLKDKNFWLAVALSSLAKFLFLFSASSLVIDLLLKKELAENVISMMNWPQLITALAGGALAWLFLKRMRHII